MKECVLLGVLVDDFLVFGVEGTCVPLAEPAPFWIVFFPEVYWAFISHCAVGAFVDSVMSLARWQRNVRSLIKM